MEMQLVLEILQRDGCVSVGFNSLLEMRKGDRGGGGQPGNGMFQFSIGDAATVSRRVQVAQKSRYCFNSLLEMPNILLDVYYTLEVFSFNSLLEMP